MAAFNGLCRTIAVRIDGSTRRAKPGKACLTLGFFSLISPDVCTPTWHLQDQRPRVFRRRYADGHRRSERALGRTLCRSHRSDPRPRCERGARSRERQAGCTTLGGGISSTRAQAGEDHLRRHQLSRAHGRVQRQTRAAEISEPVRPLSGFARRSPAAAGAPQSVREVRLRRRDRARDRSRRAERSAR